VTIIRFSLDKDIFLQRLLDALFTPHPNPLPQGERGDNFLQYVKKRKEEVR
jgi:hypothetical protein